ncbi:MAG: hypothetical protein QOD73_681 [Solirubrobacteraceae bacterium]|nr:hypothetical protein [Solirubrobacteraceae bacterium]
MSVVRPEFGPALPELLGPRVRALPRGLRVVCALVCALPVLAAALAFMRHEEDIRAPLVVREPLAFNLLVAPPLRRVTPRAGESLRLESAPGAGAPQSFAVRPLRVRPYRGDVTAVVMGMSSRLIDRMRASVPGFQWRGDGRVSYNRQPGYEIAFQARIGGHTTYGRRVLLMPNADVPPRDGLDLMILAARSDAVPSVASVGANGALKTAIRSIRFGAERP